MWQKEENSFWEEKNKEKASESAIITPLQFCIFISPFTSSVIESKDDVASSERRINGSFNIVRAIATLCFSPPEWGKKGKKDKLQP